MSHFQRSHHPNTAEAPGKWLSGSMREVHSSALWAEYVPTTATTRKRVPHQVPPADDEVWRAEGIDWTKLVNFLSTQINSVGCDKGQVLVILSDNRDPAKIHHWEFTSRLLVERSKFRNTEQFYFVWVPVNRDTGLDGRHYTWTIAAIAKALTCNPGLDHKHILFMDHDAAMLTLFEIRELIEESQQAYACSLNASHEKNKFYPGILTVSEENLNHNGGIVIFPAKLRKPGSEGRQPVLHGERWLQEIKNRTTDFLCNKTADMVKFWNDIRTETKIDSDTALGLLGECLHQQRLFTKLPIHGSMAKEREDFAIAWDFLGESITDTFFPMSRGTPHHRFRNWGYTKRARMEFAHKDTQDNCTQYMRMWGGGASEQNFLGVLKAIASPVLYLGTLPGTMGYMHREQESWKFPDPWDTYLMAQNMGPHITHAYSSRSKALLHELEGFKFWVTKEQAEKGMGLVQPFITTQTQKDQLQTPGYTTAKLSPGMTVVFKKVTRMRAWVKDIHWYQPKRREEERLSPSFVEAIAQLQWRKKELTTGDNPPTCMFQDHCPEHNTEPNTNVDYPGTSSLSSPEESLTSLWMDFPGLGGRNTSFGGGQDTWQVSVRNLYSGFSGSDVTYGPTPYSFNPKENYLNPNDYQDTGRQAASDLLADEHLQNRAWQRHDRELEFTTPPRWLGERRAVWSTHLYTPDDQVLWSGLLLLRELIGSFPNLKIIRSNSESAGTYTALVFERLFALHWPHLHVFSTMVALAMPPGQFPSPQTLEGEDDLLQRGARFSVYHYAGDRLCRIPETHMVLLQTFLEKKGFLAYLVTNVLQQVDKVFGAQGHSYGPYLDSIQGFGHGCHDFHEIAVGKGLSTKQDNLDWLVQFLTLHLHEMNCAWGFLQDLAAGWESHPKWNSEWKLGELDVIGILHAANQGLSNHGSLPDEVLVDIKDIIMGLAPIKQALLFQVVIPYYANRVYATVSTYKGSQYYTETEQILVGIKATNQLHPPGYALTLKVHTTTESVYEGWADWIDTKSCQVPSNHVDAKGLQIGDILVFKVQICPPQEVDLLHLTWRSGGLYKKGTTQGVPGIKGSQPLNCLRSHHLMQTTGISGKSLSGRLHLGNPPGHNMGSLVTCGAS
mgnify:CR=1 FL=1